MKCPSLHEAKLRCTSEREECKDTSVFDLASRSHKFNPDMMRLSCISTSQLVSELLFCLSSCLFVLLFVRLFACWPLRRQRPPAWAHQRLLQRGKKSLYGHGQNVGFGHCLLPETRTRRVCHDATTGDHADQIAQLHRATQFQCLCSACQLVSY